MMNNTCSSSCVYDFSSSKDLAIVFLPFFFYLFPLLGLLPFHPDRLMSYSSHLYHTGVLFCLISPLWFKGFIFIMMVYLFPPLLAHSYSIFFRNFQPHQNSIKTSHLQILKICLTFHSLILLT